MDLDDEMRELMAQEAAPAPGRMLSAETGDDGRSVYVLRMSSDLLSMLIMYFSGLWLGIILARRGD